jgi:nucleotide-binding universal stress UspA family protein
MIQLLKKILAPIDFSEYSMDAMRGAYELAKDVGAELHVLHVVVPETAVLAMLPLVRDAERVREIAREAAMVDQAEEELARIKRQELENSRKVVVAATVGQPVAKIAEYAEQNTIDLILLASYGRTGAEHIIGSVTERLVRAAPCSILVFRRRSR